MASPGHIPPGGVEALLSCWTAYEALTPQTYRRESDLAAGDPGRVVRTDRGALPWPSGWSIPNHQLFYQVPLGVIPMGPATDALVRAFGEPVEAPSRAQEKALIAVVLVDRAGVPLAEDAVAVSSFAWALPHALAGRLDRLGAWTRVEAALLDALRDVLLRHDEEGRALPLDAERLDAAHRWLVAQLGLPDGLAEPCGFALRVLQRLKSRTPPETPLLNSFFLRDLSRAAEHVRAGTAPTGLRAYLGMDRPKCVRDLLASEAAREEAVAPRRIPPARWPAPGGHPLVLLQQAAVNLARDEVDDAGVFAVNGPPGTGKTTLLRDVVAGSVLDRARAMAAFDDPERAFTPSGEKLGFGGNAFLHLYRLDSSLKGHEIVVASSNNNAVENVSRELPRASAMGRDAAQVGYLPTLSDALSARSNGSEDAVGEGTWGLVAAVLGNAANRAAFARIFWWDKDVGLKAYLDAVRGRDTTIEEQGDDGRRVRRQPRIVTAEAPPTPTEAKRNWARARRRLAELLRDVEAELAEIEGVRQAGLEVVRCEEAAKAAEDRLSDLRRAEQGLATALRERQEAEAEARARRDADGRRLSAHDAARPGFLARLFRARLARAWTRERSALAAAASEADRGLTTAEARTREAMAAVRSGAETTERAERELAEAQARVKALRRTVARARTKLGNRMVDAAFFARGHEDWNTAAPWLPDALHRKREEVFVAAMAVHRAFLDAAAQKMGHNLGALMSFLQSGTAPDAAKRALLPDLWSSLFAVVPVVSTTFASVDRMLGALPAGAIGWLLVDEAGQATPQAAVGAVMRARRTIAVGDPLQIPPVVTLPEKLVRGIADRFGVSAEDFAAPSASVQTLTDRASPWQATFDDGVEPRRVGAPLLVHRRCREPMFGISNTIAYAGQMVQAVGSGDDGPIGHALGPSRWIDVDGIAESKWCAEEGRAVIALLEALARAGVRKPDLFVISPFRDVALGLRRMLKGGGSLLAGLGVNDPTWIEGRVGTIHTAQGREAEAVILLLGAPEARQAGARGWAAGTPNILNVAVSRAKERLYVVGSYGAWSGVGHARTLAAALHRDPTSAAGSIEERSVTPSRRDPAASRGGVR